VTFKNDDWDKMVRRLERAHAQLVEAREARKSGDETAMQDLLDDAVLNAWRFAEYAINVLLELAAFKQERHHQQAERAEELKAAGWLEQDYKKRIDNLQSYRLKADYAGYSAARSVHYSTKDIENCLVAMAALKDEVVGHLRAAGKIQ